MTSTFAPRRAVSPLDTRAPAASLDDSDLVLPEAWSAPSRAPFPLVASAVPVAGAVVLWLVIQSPLALVLAALGPLIAVASVLDGRRGQRRERKRSAEAGAAARERVALAVRRRHDADLRLRRSRHPDVAEFLRRDGEVWRDVPARAGVVVVGRGDLPSEVRVSGARGDRAADELRASAARLEDAPIVVDLAGGITVVGRTTAAAVHRALVLQICLAAPPGSIRLVGPVTDELDWVDELPHRHATRGLRVGVRADPSVDTDVVIAHVAPGDPLPAGCRVILAVESTHRAELDHEGHTQQVSVEAVGVMQARGLAAEMAARAERTLGVAMADDVPIAFAAVVDAAPAARSGTLPAAIGQGSEGPVVVDLVLDGPHAVVAGVTGSGKSELLITWVLALAAGHTTSDVSFLLADFKGGTAFDALRALPHVTGVITDLDGAGARRALESLRAEVRWRETELARHGARDIADERVRMPRLVVVVDEVAALLGDHPELHAVFADVAARGRALGIHLVLGTQSVSGVLRDNLLANCPLRLSLRVTDAADSRAVLGVHDAAHLPGGAAARGLVLVRRPTDSSPLRARVALASAADVDAVAGEAAGSAPRRPWLPALPAHTSLAELLPQRDPHDSRMLVLGHGDEPELQRQRVVGLTALDRGLLVIGGPGAGKSTALAVLAAQASHCVRIPRSGEGTWDAVAALAAEPPPPGSVIVIDDLDTLAARVTGDHVPLVLERLERIFRGAGDAGVLVVAAMQRLSGPTVRLAELLPRRLVLGMPTRADHIAAGGDPGTYSADSPAGRGRFDQVAVQVAVPPTRDLVARDEADPFAPWYPSAPLTGLVTRRRAGVGDALRAWEGRGIRCLGLDAYAADPAVTADGPVVLVGDPDEWQREWRLLASVRSDHDLVIDTTCATEYRVLTALRDVPPYAEAGAGRAWLHQAGDAPERIVLPGAHVQAERRAWSS